MLWRVIEKDRQITHFKKTKTINYPGESNSELEKEARDWAHHH